VSLWAVRLTPRSRSLTDRGERPAASASSSCVSLASALVAESARGSLESYYWMFGQYDGAAVFDLRDSHSMAVVSLAITSPSALPRFGTHELVESSDLTVIAERAKGITYQPPGT
jgi:uncharacterized protein with GYD domain